MVDQAASSAPAAILSAIGDSSDATYLHSGIGPSYSTIVLGFSRGTVSNPDAIRCGVRGSIAGGTVSVLFKDQLGATVADPSGGGNEDGADHTLAIASPTNYMGVNLGSFSVTINSNNCLHYKVWLSVDYPDGLVPGPVPMY
jgi:hypothetical protein